MAIDIGQLEVELADREARGIREEAQGLSTIGSMVGGAVQPGLQAAENVAKLDESKRVDEATRAKDAEVKALLASGREGLVSYATEMGLDANKYSNLAANAKDEKSFIGLYELAKKEADTQLTGTELTGFSEGLQVADGIEGDDAYEKFINEQNIKISAMKSPEARKDARETLKRFEEQRTSKATARTVRNVGGASELKQIRSLRDGYIKESKKIDEVLRNTGILRSAFQSGEYRTKDGKINRVASDQALIMTFNKILDPTSVVRESEFNRTPEAAGAMNRAMGWFAKLLEGGSGLTDDGRAAVYKMSEIIAQASLADKFIKVKEYEELAGIGNISQEHINSIFPGFESFKEEYEVFREMGKDSYFTKLSDELDTELNQAKSGVIEGAHEKIDRSKYDFTNKKRGSSSDEAKSTTKPKVDKTMSVEDMMSKLPKRKK